VEEHCALSVMDINIANKDMENMVISERSYEDIVEDYLRVPLYTNVEALEVATENMYINS
jgi:hypothetical protein